MSKGSAERVRAAQPSAEVLGYAENSCYVGEERRQSSIPVTFRLFSVGNGLGAKVDVDFVATYGLYYDDDDGPLINALQYACPHVNWFYNKVYHRWLDQSRIQILNHQTGALIGQIETRRYMGRRVTAAAVESGAYGPNVMTLSQCRALRAERLAAHQRDEDTEASLGDGNSVESYTVPDPHNDT